MTNLEIKNLTPTLVEEFKSQFLPIYIERESLLLVYLFNFNYIAIRIFNVWENFVSPFYIVDNKPVCREV